MSNFTRLFANLTEAGSRGIARTLLTTKSQVPSEYLDYVAGILVERGELRIETVTPDYGTLEKKGGRPKRLYFYEPNATLAPLTEDQLLEKEAASTSGIPTTPVGRPLERQRELGVPEDSRRCVWCGKALPTQETGRPRLFCDEECRVNSGSSTGRKYLQILFGNPDSYRALRVAKLVVAADLVSQGYDLLHKKGIGEDFYLYVLGPNNTHWTVSVYPMGADWREYTGDDTADVKAVVRRDGVIDYVTRPPESTP